MTLESITWIDRYGASHAWPLGKLQGVTGLGMPPVLHVDDSALNVAGATVLATRFGKRRISIPLVLNDTEGNTRTALRNWANWLDPTIADGALRFSTLVGDTRQIDASYVGGLELTQEYEHFLSANVLFDCFDPFFYDTTTSSVTLSTSSAISGDVAAWPICSVRRVDTGFLTADQFFLLGPPIAPSIFPDPAVNMQLVAAPAASTYKTIVWDSRPGVRAVFASVAYYADPVAQYLASPASFVINPPTVQAKFMSWFQVPFDRYGAGGVPFHFGGGSVPVFDAVGTALITPAIIGSALLTDMAFQAKYFAGWLAA